MPNTNDFRNSLDEERAEKRRQASAISELMMEADRSDCPNLKPGTLNDLGSLLYDLLNY
ncbi:MAG: hypothetical protein KBT02_00270 [Treponema sp.]|nr:hypothetical protein [Candidatus Treponema caballi]